MAHNMESASALQLVHSCSSYSLHIENTLGKPVERQHALSNHQNNHIYPKRILRALPSSRNKLDRCLLRLLVFPVYVIPPNEEDGLALLPHGVAKTRTIS